jgi:hypothetical protein
MKKIFLIAGISLTIQLSAQQGVRMSEPSFSGTGCNNRNSSATLSSDGQVLSVLFDEYSAEAGGDLRRPIDRKGCNVSIPIEVPSGYSVAVMQVDYRGFNSLPAGAQSQFTVDYFFGGRVGPRNTHNFRGPLESDFISKNNIVIPSRIWSPCGRPMLLRAHSAIQVRSNTRREQAMTIIDSMDMRGVLTFHLEWKRCQQGPRG